MTLTADAALTNPPTEALEMAPEVTRPTVVGARYELGPIIGRGGMSTVYEAIDRRTGGRVAVKVFRPGIELADSPARRLREVQLASAVHHPGVVRVLDAYVDDSDRVDGCTFLVTELVEGRTLGERLRVAPLSEREVVGLGAALCVALAEVHRAGIIHRDIKPANVLLSAGDDGLLHPKLADFGIALMTDSTRMTATGFMAGTANYLSPEQVQGQPLTPAADMYSLGLILIEAVRGTPVFAGSGVEAVVARLSARPAPPEHLDIRLRRLLERMTDRHPANRPTAQSAAHQLQRLSGGSLASDIFAIDATPPMLAPRLSHSERFGTHRRRAAMIGGLLAVAVAGATGFGLSNSRDGHSAVTPTTGRSIASTERAASAPTTSSAGAIASASTRPVSEAPAGRAGIAPTTPPAVAAVVSVRTQPAQMNGDNSNRQPDRKDKGKKKKGDD